MSVVLFLIVKLLLSRTNLMEAYVNTIENRWNAMFAICLSLHLGAKILLLVIMMLVTVKTC